MEKLLGQIQEIILLNRKRRKIYETKGTASIDERFYVTIKINK